MKLNIDAAVKRIRQYRLVNDITKSGLANLAGVPEGVTRHMDEDGWNPTLATLRKLDLVVDGKMTPKDILLKEDVC